MRLTEARRLRPGDEVVVDGMPAGRRRGTVVRATSKGGVQVKIGDHALWFPYPLVRRPHRLVSSSIFRR
jgi:hypothetical protein